MTEGSGYSAPMDSDSSEVSPVLQLRISLRGVSPPVWRRLLIPEQITIAQLHHVMQFAMGWNDEHLHRFIIRGWRYGGHRDGAFQFFDGPDTLNLAAFGLHEHERFAYLYDFTSWWLHDVRVERRTCHQRSRPLPCCVAGAGRCPPEDTGGPERYMNALEVPRGGRHSVRTRCDTWSLGFRRDDPVQACERVGQATVGPAHRRPGD